MSREKICEVKILEKNIAHWNNLAVEAIHDEESFTELYEHFFPRVYKFIYAKTSDAEIADEIISRTFMKMFENLQNYNPTRAAFSTWLYQIALNELKMFWRSKNYRGEHEESWDENFNPAAPEFEQPENQFLLNENKKILLKAVETLSKREQKIIELKFKVQKEF